MTFIERNKIFLYDLTSSSVSGDNDEKREKPELACVIWVFTRRVRAVSAHQFRLFTAMMEKCIEAFVLESLFDAPGLTSLAPWGDALLAGECATLSRVGLPLD